MEKYPTQGGRVTVDPAGGTLRAFIVQVLFDGERLIAPGRGCKVRAGRGMCHQRTCPGRQKADCPARDGTDPSRIGSRRSSAVPNVLVGWCEASACPRSVGKVLDGYCCCGLSDSERLRAPGRSSIVSSCCSMRHKRARTNTHENHDAAGGG